MRKLLSFIVVAVFLFIATMGVSAMDAPRGRPEYLQVTVASVAELLEFIRTENVDTFQGGRYQRGITALRERGSVFIPSFERPNGEIRGTTLVQDDALFNEGEYTILVHFFWIDEERVVVEIRKANENLLDELNGNISEYVVAQHGSNDIITTTSQTTVTIYGEERTVEIVAVTPSSGTSRWAIFIVDGFEIAVIQDQDSWSDEHLHNLQLTMYDIATGLPVDGASIATPPPNDNNGENGVETPEPTPTPPFEPTPTIEPTPDVPVTERENTPLGLLVPLVLGAVAVGGAALWLLLWKRRGREEGNN